ncbi:hypothetical protein [Rathayibacter sp. VKM Ac-2928]|uniref:hypothetical protein n=1 Tax=Rathayibacter sp. VKM Ac-2928 TaxID=2929479 RepID=UPI001FB3B151|nr:hypothetical protein [Rathayibacter sp. VKM Ac-2928]MCJ1685355.1 hypothetical protein [Rathayibacter sp. VKM Ac-2928]
MDFFEFASSEDRGYPDDVVPLFACSTSHVDGGGSVAITPDAVYLREGGDLTRIDAVDIRSWRSASRGPLFALTVECDEAHVTHLVAHLRSATVQAMSKAVGPEGVQLRAA